MAVFIRSNLSKKMSGKLHKTINSSLVHGFSTLHKNYGIASTSKHYYSFLQPFVGVVMTRMGVAFKCETGVNGNIENNL